MNGLQMKAINTHLEEEISQLETVDGSQISTSYTVKMRMIGVVPVVIGL